MNKDGVRDWQVWPCAVMSVVAALSVPVASAEIVAVTALELDPAPQVDLLLAEGQLPASNVLNGARDAFPDIVLTTKITGFVTAMGRVSDVAGAVHARVSETTPPGEPDPVDDSIRNYWGAAGQEVDGHHSLIGLDVSVGVDNALSADLMFEAPVMGADGQGNDFFLTDLFGDDSIHVYPLDSNGVTIGTGAVIASGPGRNNVATDDPGQWGWVGVDLTVAIESLPDSLFGQPAGKGTVFDNLKVAAVAFDIEDLFESADKVQPVSGLKIVGLDIGSGNGSFDLGVAGVNRAAFAN